MRDDFGAFKEEVKNRVDIVDVVSEFVELKKRGVNYSGPCPFHQETKPSFSVNRERQFFHCFGCGKGGDVISFLTDITGMSFLEALAQLAERAGIAMPERTETDPNLKNTIDLVMAANLAAAEYFHRSLAEPVGEGGLAYLEERGLTRETVRTFRLGFCPEDPTGLVTFAREKGVKPQALETAGILKKNSYGASFYNPFGGRVIFPIIDATGRVLGFGARLLSGEGAKYKNSPETPVYHKSNILYGVYQARGDIRRARTAIVVEGYLDVISLHQAGIKNVIAASGTAFTAEQARLINRMARNVILLFDGDRAGLAAAARSADTLLAGDTTIGVVVLPEGHDPDSFVRAEGPDALRALLGKSIDIWEFKLRVLATGAVSAEERLSCASEIADAIAQIADDLRREVYISDLSPRLGVDIDAMRRAVNGRLKRRKKSAARESAPAIPSVNRTELELLGYLIRHPHLARGFVEEMGSKPFTTPVARAVADEYFHRIVEGLPCTPSALMDGFTEDEPRRLIAAAAMQPGEETDAETYLTHTLHALRTVELREEHTALTLRIARETDPAKKQSLVDESRLIWERLKTIERS